MDTIANIIVQLIHIEGPLKGEIQDFFETEILIGRHRDCQVQYPKDVITISRKHARIQRDGNRFKIIDQSTNGTFVNGKMIAEAYLNNKDVITFSKGGPKVSFFTHVNEPYAIVQSPSPEKKQSDSIKSSDSTPSGQAVSSKKSSLPGPDIDSEKVKVPFAIKYGPILRSFHTLPITIGQNPQCDFIIEHDGIEDYQAQISFFQHQYWIKDLTGISSIYIDGIGVVDQVPLKPNARLSLSLQGPQFRFLRGRLTEIETIQTNTSNDSDSF